MYRTVSVKIRECCIGIFFRIFFLLVKFNVWKKLRVRSCITQFLNTLVSSLVLSFRYHYFENHCFTNKGCRQFFNRKTLKLKLLNISKKKWIILNWYFSSTRRREWFGRTRPRNHARLVWRRPSNRQRIVLILSCRSQMGCFSRKTVA